MSVTVTPPHGSPAAEVTVPLEMPAATARLPLVARPQGMGRHRLAGGPLTIRRKQPGRRMAPWTPDRQRADAVALRPYRGQR
jgi:hypothetical protein